MDSQLSLRLPTEMVEKLDFAAQRLKRKRSDVVRLALDQFLETVPTPPRAADRVRDLLGKVDSGISDLGTRHREHLIARLTRGR